MTHLDKIIFIASNVLRKEIKDMKLLSLLHLMEVNLTSFPLKCFFQKNKIEKFKRFIFSRTAYVLKKIDPAASNREAVNNFEI